MNKNNYSPIRYYEGEDKKRIGYDFYADIAENIVAMRKELSWTQEELAKKSGIKLSRLREIEGCRIRVWMKDLSAISKAMQVTEFYLTGETPLSEVGECLFTVHNERSQEFAPYVYAQTYGLAFLKAHQSVSHRIIWFEPRDRAIVALRGVPYTEKELESNFRKRKPGEDDFLE
ncbi:MAG: helix-turn-helix domain-containing protein [Clostridia bacterium]|nr:helix-turn-helix domain-containing protein [Clostridia bacterium]